MLKRMFAVALESLVIAAVLFALLEISLRLFPILVPLSLLVNFEKHLRDEIAARRRLPALRNTIELERGDNGPPLRTYRSGALLEIPFDDADQAAGAGGAVKLDKQGFCNAEDAAEASSADIVALGDSFTWCVGVKAEESWPGKLGAITGQTAYSLGLGGTGPYEYLELFKKFGAAKSPKAVIMNIYGGNDLRSVITFLDYRKGLTAKEGKEYLVAPCVGLPKAACVVYRTLKEGALGRKSYAFNLLANGTREGLLAIQRRVGLGETAEEPNFRYRVSIGGKEILFNRGNADTDDLTYAARLRAGEISLNAFGDALREFVAIAKTSNFQPLVSFTPAAYVAYADAVSFEDTVVGELIQWFSAEEVKYLRSLTEEVGYEFIDFTPALAAASKKNAGFLYFPSNVHLTRAGHEVIAETLAEFFNRRKQERRGEK